MAGSSWLNFLEKDWNVLFLCPPRKYRVVCFLSQASVLLEIEENNTDIPWNGWKPNATGLGGTPGQDLHSFPVICYIKII